MRKARPNHGSLCRRSRQSLVLVPVLATLLAGCTVGPDFKPPIGPETGSLVPGKLASPGSAGGASQRFQQGRDIPGDWWRLFRSHQLNGLVDRALTGNFDLKAAEAALKIAQANVEAGRGAFFPQLSANYQAQRQKVSLDPLVPSTPNGQPYYTTHTAGLTVTYVADVFGGVRRQVESLEAMAEGARFQLEATQLTLTANVALAAIQEASLRGQIAATEKIVRIEKDLLGLQKKSQSLGQIGAIDVATQEAALAQVELTLPPLQKSLAQARDQMIALSGRLPGNGLPEKFELASFRLPSDLPVSLPSDIVRQRPDVRAAESNMHAASASVGVAIANRLPQFSLLANGGTMSSAFSNVLNLSTPYSFWTVAGSVGQVLFDGFTLEQKQRAAEAGLDQAAAQYHSTVITGFQNVADALQALNFDAKALRAALAGEVAAEKSLHLIREQLRLGQVSALQVLNAQQTYLQASLAVVQAKVARLSDTVALFQALGGGWWNRDDPGRGPPPRPEWLVNVRDLRGRTVQAVN